MAKSKIQDEVVDRPFPWICPRCLREEVRPAVKSHVARVKHDGVEYELSIPSTRNPDLWELWRGVVHERRG